MSSKPAAWDTPWMGRSAPLRPSPRDALLQAALEIYATRPRASLGEVAVHAGVGRATLVRHFSNREALMLEAGIRTLRSLSNELAGSHPREGTALAAMRRLLAILLPAGQKIHAIFSMPELIKDPLLSTAAKCFNAHVARGIDRCAKENLLAEDFSPAWFASAFRGLLFAAWTAVDQGQITPVQAETLLLRTLLHGFGARPVEHQAVA